MRGVQCQLESRRPRVKVQPVMVCVYTQLCQEPWRSTPPLDTQSANGRATAHQIMHPPYWQCQLTRLCAQTKNKHASERASERAAHLGEGAGPHGVRLEAHHNLVQQVRWGGDPAAGGRGGGEGSDVSAT